MDVRTIEPEHLMRCMSFVFQDVTLFNDTVFNNIRVGLSLIHIWTQHSRRGEVLG